MTYVNCPRCRLAIRSRPSLGELELCPRCMGRTGEQIPMYTSQRRAPAPANRSAAGRSGGDSGF